YQQAPQQANNGAPVEKGGFEQFANAYGLIGFPLRKSTVASYKRSEKKVREQLLKRMRVQQIASGGHALWTMFPKECSKFDPGPIQFWYARGDGQSDVGTPNYMSFNH
ncbi:hypothetical protein OSTOST_24347, partial [Ostertagia ostertagi]